MDSGSHANMKRTILTRGTGILGVISRAGRPSHPTNFIWNAMVLLSVAFGVSTSSYAQQASSLLGDWTG